MSQRLIVLDGPDRCGKTEMSRALSERFDIPYFKNTNETTRFHDPDYYIKCCEFVESFFLPYLEQSGASLIQDRSWPSEFVYSRVFQRRRDDALLRRIDTRYAELGTRVIIPTRSSYEGIVDDIDSIGPRLSEIDKTYREFADWTDCRVLTMNVDDEDLERELAVITAFLNEG